MNDLLILKKRKLAETTAMYGKRVDIRLEKLIEKDGRIPSRPDFPEMRKSATLLALWQCGLCGSCTLQVEKKE